MSDNTRRMVDEEQQYLTDLAHRRALKLVAENRTLLEAFAFTLLENEVLEREDIERIVAATEADAAPGQAGAARRRTSSRAARTSPAAERLGEAVERRSRPAD